MGACVQAGRSREVKCEKYMMIFMSYLCLLSVCPICVCYLSVLSVSAVCMPLSVSAIYMPLSVSAVYYLYVTCVSVCPYLCAIRSGEAEGI